MQEPAHIKDEAHKLIELLPDDATWEDLTRLMLEQQLIEEGIADVEAGEFGSAARFARSWECLIESNLVRPGAQVACCDPRAYLTQK